MVIFNTMSFEGAWRILDHSQAITESRQTMQQIVLDESEQQVFAEAALQVRFPETWQEMRPEQVLRRKRMADTNTDL